LPQALLEKQVRIVRYGLALAASLETKIPSKFILILKVFRSISFSREGAEGPLSQILFS